MSIIQHLVKNPVDLFILFVFIMMFGIAITSLIKESTYVIRHKRVRKDPFLFIVYLLILLLALAGLYSRMRFYSLLQALQRVPPTQMATIRIYPKRYRPDDKIIPLTVSLPDPMVEEFFSVTPHIHAEWFRHGTFTSWDLVWYMEVIIGQDTVSLTCTLQPKMNNLVLGEIGRVGKDGENLNYGPFQSQLLFQWYQKYHSRWLKSDESMQHQSRVTKPIRDVYRLII